MYARGCSIEMHLLIRMVVKLETGRELLCRRDHHMKVHVYCAAHAKLDDSKFQSGGILEACATTR